MRSTVKKTFEAAGNADLGLIVQVKNNKPTLLETITWLAATTQSLSAERAAAAIRGHWRIETTSHYTRDVTLGEDRSRIRCNPGVFARLRSFGFNILKANRVGTLNQDRYRVALGGFEALSNLVV